MSHFIRSSILTLVCALSLSAEAAEVRENQLWIDDKAQPQLWGAELQYFRLRGGFGPNVPRHRVIEIWNRALDRMTEAGMNSISFYIPWDFHEYAPGKFDFTGTVDEDGDGNADYPSRDLPTFFRLIHEHGIHRIMVRPGPYINAEWGFLGFGAIPLWFHQKYPDSHMRNAEGLKTKLYDYHNPDLLRHTSLWFAALHTQILRHYIGPQKPIAFLQIDNETNFMWQSIFHHDYGPRALARYRKYLRTRYGNITTLNQAHRTHWNEWSAVQAPHQPGVNIAEDQDWHRFQDQSIHEYLQIVRKDWENLGVREPEVIFTLAESYNAMTDGMLPNFEYRSDPGKTGLMTMNVYPKTYESENHSLLNLPFKVDHDIKAMTSAAEHYFGAPQEWLLGPEIQGGWWRGVPVSQAARQQTYLSSLGHGLKALFIYYFTEGDNWQSEWAKEQIAPLFNRFRQTPLYATISDDDLPDLFWNQLQAQVDNELLVGFDSRSVMQTPKEISEQLYFDAPLDGEAHRRAPYNLIRHIGTQLVVPHATFLARSLEVTDDAVILKDTGMHVPSSDPNIDSVKMNADWSGALLGYLMQTGLNPRILHWKLNSNDSIAQSKIIFLQSSEVLDPSLVRFLRDYVTQGGTLVNDLPGIFVPLARFIISSQV